MNDAATFTFRVDGSTLMLLSSADDFTEPKSRQVRDFVDATDR